MFVAHGGGGAAPAGESVALPEGLARWPVEHVSGPALDLLELVLLGAVGATAFGDGPVPLLPVGAESADRLRPGGSLVLEDAEGSPVAVVAVEAVLPREGGAAVRGTPHPLRSMTHGPFRRLRRSPEQVRCLLDGAPPLVVVTDRPLLRADLTAVTARAAGRPVLLTVPVGAGQRPWPSTVGLVRSLLAVRPELPDGSLVLPLSLPRTDDPALDGRLLAAAATAYGGDLLTLPEVPADDLVAAVRAGEDGPLPRTSREALLRAVPDPSRTGLVLLLTGLSGSGKSTVARGVHEALVESTDRSVTLLDGDVVRRHLSKGLGFSRADRDTNIRRIGYVAAEIARHGGVALCAPIAPYASTRAAVRAMAEQAGAVFVLVHVSTPLEVCEARDRKGLYARARAGLIPEFTGVSDPYEEPVDADLVLDTSRMDVDAAVDAVLDLLVARGLTPGAQREAAQ